MQKAVNIGNLNDPHEVAKLRHYLVELYSLVNFVRLGTSAPTYTPLKVGDIFINTVAVKVYVATGTVSSANWTIVN